MRTWLTLPMMCLFVLPAQAKYGGGSGTAADPYQIRTAEQMNAVGADLNDWNKYFKLVADIDLSGFDGKNGRSAFRIIGATGNTPFKGVFDGNGHRIAHLTITGEQNVGLFGVLASGAQVRNVGLVEVDVNGVGFQSSSVGALAGQNAGVVTRCFSTGAVRGTNMIGGIVGSNTGDLMDSSSAATITGRQNYVGGLVGSNGGRVTRCSSRGAVTGIQYVGGLAGSNSGSLTDCYSMSAVCGTSLWAGLVGINSGAVTRCYSTGSVTGAGLPRGGLVASNSGVVLYALWDRETSRWPSSAAGVGLTTSQMMDAAILGLNGFGSDPNWVLDAGRDYPRLAWEGKAGQIIPEPNVDWMAGRGTPDTPYVIDTAKQLTRIANASFLWNRHFVLRADLDLAPTLPDGQVFAQAVILVFPGIFDGNGHSISHLTIKGGSEAGLFGRLRPGAEVRDLALIDADVTGSDQVGAIVGYNDGGSLTRCSSTGRAQGVSCVGALVGKNSGTARRCDSTGTVSGLDTVGGLAGSNAGALIDCRSGAAISGGSHIGGLAGSNSGSTIRCSSSGMVAASNQPVSAHEAGGLVGYNQGRITACYASGGVTGQSRVGGLAGSNGGTVIDCYSVGTVSGEEEVGGLIGSIYGGTVTNCYSAGAVAGTKSSVGGLAGNGGSVRSGVWDMQTSGRSQSSAGIGLTTAEMRDPEMLGLNGFTGDPNWVLDAGRDYPRLAWEGTPGSTIGVPQVAWLKGAGTVPMPYQVDTREQLIRIGRATALWDKQFVLGADLDLDPNLPGGQIFGQPVVPIFSGVFDGKGHQISHLRIKGNNDLGLFGQVASGAVVKDLGIVDVNIVSLYGNVAALAGHNAGLVTRCYTTGVVSGGASVGGLVGYNTGILTDCHSATAVEGQNTVGGLVGNNSGRIVACCSTGAVMGTRSSVGGLAGTNGGSVIDCYSLGVVSGGGTVGGLIGSSYGGTVTKCYSAGAVSGGPSAGGLMGSGGSSLSGVWDMQTSGLSRSAAGIGLTTAEMKDPEMLGLNGFAGDPNWVLDAGRDYPRLAWEGKPGRIIPEPRVDWLPGGPRVGAPYQVDTRDRLIRIGRATALWDKQFVLGADLDLDRNLLGGQTFGQAVIPIFTGVFDGNGHTISRLTVRGDSEVGLFGRLESGAQVRNLGLVDVNVAGSHSVGTLAGQNAGVVTHCYSTGAVTGQGQNTGGLVGSNTGSLIDSHSAAGVNGGQDYVGGLAGSNSGRVTRCSGTGPVTGIQYVGGLVGSNSGPVNGCYAAGVVSGSRLAGGLVGSNGGALTDCYSLSAVRGASDCAGLIGSNGGTVTRCYSTGAVAGEGPPLGGFVAFNSGVVLHALWDVKSSGQAGSAAGVGLATSEMMDAAILGLNGFGSDPNWVLDAGRDYPRLAWEGKAGQIIPEPNVDWMAGRGTAEAPYVIDTAKQLIRVASASFLWEKRFVLKADLDLAPTVPDGQVFAQAIIPLFLGIFDGNGHAISHLTIKGGPDAGLFGRLRPGAEVRDLAVIDADVTGSDRVGTLVGYNDGGCLTRCSSTGSVQGVSSVGGLVGNNGGYVAHCYSFAQCDSKGSAGGLVGQNWGRIIGSFAAGAIRGTSPVGGLVGQNQGDLIACYSTGAVGGSSSVGGLVGDVSNGTVTHSYSIGVVGATNKGAVGGLVGYRSSSASSVVGCFWDTQTSGQIVSAGGTGLTTAQMREVSTYLKAGWDFVGETYQGTWEIWQMPPGGGYPVLAVFNDYLPPQLPGRGTADEPYLIANAQELGAVIHYSAFAHYRLAASLDLAGIRWSAATIPWLAGTFDGADHTIAHLEIDGGGYLGLFGRLPSDAEVRDLDVVDVNVAGSGSCVGSLAGHNEGRIHRCLSSGRVRAGGTVGGFVGSNAGQVADCHSTAAVEGQYTVGGLVGYNQGNLSECSCTGPVQASGTAGGLAGANSGTVTQCCSAGAVSATEVSVGGLLGSNRGNVTACYSTAAVRGGSSIGGLVGANGRNVTGCYSAGSVTGSGSFIGGLIGAPSAGRGSRGSTTASFWDTQTSGQPTSAGGTGKTTAEMQTAKTFLDAGWDFVGETANGTEDLWWILEGKDYPKLWWELEVKP